MSPQMQGIQCFDLKDKNEQVPITTANPLSISYYVRIHWEEGDDLD